MARREIVSINPWPCRRVVLEAHADQEEPQPEQDEVDTCTSGSLQFSPLVRHEDGPPRTNRKGALRVRGPRRLPVDEQHLHGALLVDELEDH